jgi:NTP pyrophosphatase (non-canonical NTP hydrolase)
VLADQLKRRLFYGPSPGDSLGAPLAGLANERLLTLLHAGLGMTTEAIEFLEKAIGLVLHPKDLPEVPRDYMLLELGDELWYVALAINELKSNFGDVMGANIAKLRDRFPDKFSGEAAIQRDAEANDQAGAQALSAATREPGGLLHQGKRVFPSGATSSATPRYDLIPMAALDSLARRFEKGLVSHPDGYNALGNQAPLADTAWMCERLSHGARHCMIAIAKLTGQPLPPDVAPNDDDAGAIMFAGAILAARPAALARREPDYSERDE